MIRIAIPNKLRGEGITFIRVRSKEKAPLDIAWVLRPEIYEKQKDKTWKHKETRELYTIKKGNARVPYIGELTNLKWNDEKLTDWTSKGNNYGVMGGGPAKLIMVDFDDPELERIIVPLLPPTFTTQSGTGGQHKYYKTDNPLSFKVFDAEMNTRADIQGEGKQVVGPGSIHPNGKAYTIKDNQDIAYINYKELRKILDPHNLKPKKEKKIVVQKPISNGNDFQQELFDSVSFEDLISEFGVDTSKNPSNCPFHSSRGQQCLGWTGEVANCFHCGDSWNKMSWLKDNLKVDAKGAIEWLAEREGKTDELEASRKEWKSEKVKEEVAEVNKLLKGTSKPEEEYSSKKLNWIEENITWPEMKEPVRILIKGKDQMFFVAHKNDIIEGKPQLIHSSMKRISLVKKILSRKKVDNEWVENISYKFLDEPHDRRTQGSIESELALDFWLYRVFFENKEYYVLSEQEFPIQTCSFKGMLMDVNDLTEITSSMRIRSISRLFFADSFDPVIKVLEPKQLIEFCKERKITEEDWFNVLNYHPLHTRNRFPFESNMIRSIQLLSSKQEEWPMHLGVMGPAGTKKSSGYIETISEKFSEESEIVEGGNSRIKFLSPSFKEKPANVGYLARCERVGFIDELGKMIEFQDKQMHEASSNVLGEINFLLDHKRRSVGSGNDNECVVQANSKFIFVTNPVKGKRKLGDHVGTIDPTTMSRIFWWVQDVKEIEFALSDDSVEELPRSPGDTWGGISTTKKPTREIPLSIYLWCTRSFTSRDEFLTLFDTCNSFRCNFDDKRASNLNYMARNLAQEPMKGVWAPRGLHHTKLLLDGIIKHRCLFKDYDETFTAKEEDYTLAEALLLKMVRNWSTDLGVKRDNYTGKGTL